MRRLAICLFACLWAVSPSAEAGERPTSMRLFPGRAVFFVRTPDASEVSERFNTGGGQELLTDPEIAPFLQTLFAKVDASFREGPGKVTGGGLSDLLALFEGEVAFAVVPRRNEAPGVIFLADTVSGASRSSGDRQALVDGQDRAKELLTSIESFARARGDQVATEEILSVKASVIRRGDNVREAFGAVERDGVLLLCNDRILLESVIAKWDEAEGLTPAGLGAEDGSDEIVAGDDEAKRARRLRTRYAGPLSDNTGFTEALRECVSERMGGGDESPPQLVMFLDPVGIFRAAAQDNAGMRIALATLPILGLDGVEGIAAAGWINEGDWDSLFRAHLLLDNPRAGILKMARLLPCDPTPGDAIPSEVSSYTCGAVDLKATYNGAEQLYDRIRGDGKFAELVEERFTKQLGVAPEKPLELLTGRFVSLQAFGDTPEGQAPRATPARAVFLEATDSEELLKLVLAMIKKQNAEVRVDQRGAEEYVVLVGMEERAIKLAQEGPGPGRGPVPLTCLATIGDDLVLCETVALMQKLLDTQAGEVDRLRDYLPYRLTASRAQRLGEGTVGGEEGRLLMYQDPSAQFRQWHVAGTSDESRAQLERMAEFAPPMRWLRDTLEETPVPSIEAMMKYASPSGSAVYDTPRGFRYVAFSFKTSGDD